MDVVLQVAARNGRAARLVHASCGDVELRDTFDTDKAAARAKFIAMLAERLGIKPADIAHLDQQMVAAADAADKQAEAAAASVKDDHAVEVAELLRRMPDHVKQQAYAALDDPYLLTRIQDDIATLGVAGEDELTLTLYVIGVSRLLEKPLAAIIQGPSATGKSYIVEQVAKLFPPEAVVHATQMTPQALFHMPAGSLSHKWVVAGERSRVEDDQTAEGTRALREMLSAGRLTKLMPMRVGDAIETVPIDQEGPIAFVEGTTLAKVFDEDANRCLLLATDERASQTERIVTTLANLFAGDVATPFEVVVQRHHAMQRILQPFEVVVPYAKRIGELFPVDRVTVRRAFPQVMAMVQALALLHQRQRQMDAAGRILAAPIDYVYARQLLAKPISRSIGHAISDGALRYFDRLTTKVSGETFTTTEAVHGDEAHENTVRGYLRELQAAAAIEQTEPPRGAKPATWRMTGVKPEAVDVLPTPEAVFGTLPS